MISGFVSVLELVSNLHYSHLNFKLVFSMNSIIISIVLLTFFLFDHVEILKANCHKRKKMVLARNLLLELEVPLIFYAMPTIFSLFAYHELGHIRFGGKNLNNLKDVIS